MLNVVDGCMPSDLGAGTSAEIEEERRLLYVAMTRAKDDLHLIVPQRFFTHGQTRNGDRHVYASRTRFIPPDLLDNSSAAPGRKPRAAQTSAKPVQAPVDIRERVRENLGIATKVCDSRAAQAAARCAITLTD